MSDWKCQFREWGVPFVCICCCFVNINIWEQCWHYILNFPYSSLSQGFEYTHCRWHREREKSNMSRCSYTRSGGKTLFCSEISITSLQFFFCSVFCVIEGEKVACHHQWEYGAWVSFTNWIWRVRKKIEKSLR